MSCSSVQFPASLFHAHDVETGHRTRRRVGHPCAFVTRFRYALDPLCLIACVAYAINRFAIKPHSDSDFLHSHFNDVLLIPAALPFFLWAQRKVEVRPHDEPPSFQEILFHWAVWSVLFEGIGPYLKRTAVGDPWDVLAYFVGGVIAWAIWNRQMFRWFQFNGGQR